MVGWGWGRGEGMGRNHWGGDMVEWDFGKRIGI